MNQEGDPIRRRTVEPKEGVHYVVDLYAFLGVPRIAEEDALRSRRNIMLHQNHPDRFEGLDPKLKTQANFRTKILNRVTDTLLNPEAKLQYDRMLADWTGLISPDGHPTIRLSDYFMATTDPEQLRGQIDQQMELHRLLIGHDPKKLEKLEKLIQADQDPPEFLLQAYDEALFKQQVDLTVRDDLRREALGIELSNANNPAKVLAVEAESLLAKRRSELEYTQELERLALESGQLKAIAAPEVPINPKSNQMEVVTTKVLEHFDQIVEDIKKLAQKRDEVTAKRIEVSRGEYSEGQGELRDKLIVRYVIGEKDQWFNIALDDDNLKFNPTDTDLFALAKDKEKLSELIAQGYSIMTVTHREGIPISEDMKRAVEEHYIQLEAQNADNFKSNITD